MQIHISDARSGDRISEDIFTSGGLLVLSKGAVLNDKELVHLKRYRIDFIEIDWRPGIVPKKPKTVAKAETINPQQSPLYNPLLRPLYQDAIAGAEQLFTKAMLEGRIYEEDVKTSFQPLIDNFRSERDVVSLLLMLNSTDDYTYKHSVQVGMLSYFLARWLGWSELETVRAGQAGFLHDIGKCKIPSSVLNKPAKLGEIEQRLIRSTPQLGCDILKSSFNNEAVALAALQHCERMDGSGYPYGLSGDEIHPFARIVAISDIYSAMITNRAYSKRKDLFETLKELYEMSFQKLDPVMTHTFIRHMIQNFIGKQVVLSDGQTGQVIMPHPTDFFRPLVQVGEKFIDLSIIRTLEIARVNM